MVTKCDNQPTTTDRVNIEQSASGRWAGRVLQLLLLLICVSIDILIIFWVVNIKRRQCWTVAQVFAHYTARRHLSPQYNRVALLDFPGGTVNRCKYYAPLPGGIIINTLYEQMHSAQCRCTGKIVTLWFCAP